MRHFYRKIPGWFDFRDIYLLAVRRAEDGDSLVEVGSWMGRSTAFLAVEAANSGKSLMVYSVDTWLGCPVLKEAAAKSDVYGAFLAKTARASSMIVPIREESEKAASRFADGSLAMVFLDAGHSYEAVRKDIWAWMPKVKPGGLLGGHDFTNRKTGVKRAVRALLRGGVAVVGSSWLVRRCIGGAASARASDGWMPAEVL